MGITAPLMQDAPFIGQAAPESAEPSFDDPQIQVEATASALWMHGKDLAVMALEPKTRPHFSAKVRDDMHSTILRLQLILSGLKS